MICGGSFRRKRLISDDIYGFLPGTNRLGIDENVQRENRSEKKLSRSNSVRNGEKPYVEGKKRGLFRSSSFRVRSSVEGKQEEPKRLKSILKKTPSKYTDFDECRPFVRSNSVRMKDVSGDLEEGPIQIDPYDMKRFDVRMDEPYSTVDMFPRQDAESVETQGNNSLRPDYEELLSSRTRNTIERQNSVYRDSEFIRANSLRIKRQCEDRAQIIDETKGVSRTSSFCSRYGKEENDVSDAVSRTSSTDEPAQELEGSLRARIYRRRHTIVIVCRNKVSFQNINIFLKIYG